MPHMNLTMKPTPQAMLPSVNAIASAAAQVSALRIAGLLKVGEGLLGLAVVLRIIEDRTA